MKAEPRSSRHRSWLALTGLAALIAGYSALAVLALGAPRAATSEGSFTGTWSRVDIAQRQAVQIRRDPATGQWQLRLYWRRGDIEIDTAWQTRHEYLNKGFLGAIEIEIDQERSSDDRLFARYHREQRGTRDSLMTEDGELQVYRSDEFGRTLVWYLPDLTRRVTIGEALTPDEADSGPLSAPYVRYFEKQAKRMLLWDEIYW
ncbi:MAG: hypothetical protein JSV80_06160 [Acidobacteriota bacterium]|nr:MAG: hypothetical protein JSV80_06160 [Acidobacteriota bacterium]